jgi:hypothetical protein
MKFGQREYVTTGRPGQRPVVNPPQFSIPLRIAHSPDEIRSPIRRGPEQGTIYNFIYSGVDETPEGRDISLKRMVGASGFELPTSWSPFLEPVLW